MLRGRLLEGAVAALPESYTGVVVAGQGRGLVDGQDRLARATAAFEELQYWNYDRKAGEGNAYSQAMQWTRVAEKTRSSCEHPSAVLLQFQNIYLNCEPIGQ